MDQARAVSPLNASPHVKMILVEGNFAGPSSPIALKIEGTAPKTLISHLEITSTNASGRETEVGNAATTNVPPKARAMSHSPRELAPQ